jgi:hypothetical protein
MRPKSLPILFLCFHFCLISIFYFFSLCLHIDGKTALITDCVLIIPCGWIVYREFNRDAPSSIDLSEYINIAIWLILSCCLLFICQKIATVNGDWDGWAMWNTHAKFLTDKNNWTALFDPAMAFNSPDYPLNLPCFIASFWAFTTHYDKTVPFLASLFTVLAIPGIIYFEISAKSKLIAVLSFVFFLLNEFYVRMGVAQYADELLGLFYLCSLVCITYIDKEASGNKIILLLTGFFIINILWTKNEGLLFVLPLLLFYTPTILKQKNRFIFIGMLLPLAALLIFKLHFATQSFAAKNFDVGNFKNFLDFKRYQIIVPFTWKLLNDKFYIIIYGSLFLLIKFFFKRKINRLFLIWLCAFFLYISIFLFFNFDLKWQLETSLDRLLLQLEIPFAYLLFTSVADSLQNVSAWKNNDLVRRWQL